MTGKFIWRKNTLKTVCFAIYMNLVQSRLSKSLKKCVRTVMGQFLKLRNSSSLRHRNCTHHHMTTTNHLDLACTYTPIIHPTVNSNSVDATIALFSIKPLCFPLFPKAISKHWLAAGSVWRSHCTVQVLKVIYMGHPKMWNVWARASVYVTWHGFVLYISNESVLWPITKHIYASVHLHT